MWTNFYDVEAQVADEHVSSALGFFCALTTNGVCQIDPMTSKSLQSQNGMADGQIAWGSGSRYGEYMHTAHRLY